MRFAEAIDLYIADQRIAGRINSPLTAQPPKGGTPAKREAK